MLTAIMDSPATVAHFLIDIIPDMCFVLSEKGDVLSYNKKAQELLSLPSDIPQDLSFRSLLAEDSPRPVEAMLKSARTASDGAEVQFRSSDGKLIFGYLNIRKMAGPDREYLYVVAQDISEVKRKELDLLRFSNVVHYTVNPIQITDAKGRMIYVNPAFERTSGYTREELLGLNPNKISSGKHGKAFWQEVWKKIGKGEVWTGEIENRRKDGEPMYTHLLISPIIDNDGKVVGYLGSHRDISQQKELERQLMHSQKMESLGTLAAGIAHEVGNPLASISSIVQVITRTSSDDFTKEKLKLVDSQVRRITKIIRDLVDFSRPSNYNVQMTDVVKMLSEAIDIVKIAKKAKDITFKSTLPTDIPIVSLVPDQLSQVFINILLNAVDAMHGKKGTITSIVFSDDKYITIVVRDTGSGIPEENLDKIFEPFFTTKKVGEGTGMGLWVSYGIVKSFGGDITVHSSPGKGTTFAVTLPVPSKE